MTSEVPNKGLEWTNLILGAALASAAFVFGELPVVAWNAGVVGSLVVCCSIVALYRYGSWAEWSNLILGCWAAAAPFLLGFAAHPVAMWTHVVLGLSIATIAGIQLVADRKGRGSPGPRSSHFE